MDWAASRFGLPPMSDAEFSLFLLRSAAYSFDQGGPINEFHQEVDPTLPNLEMDECAPPDVRRHSRYSTRLPPPPTEIIPDTSRIDKSELCLMTKVACGYVEENEKKNSSMMSMIQNRTFGQGLTRSQRCGMNNRYLPSKQRQRINYHCRVYCGTHSSDGKYFLSVTQDRLLRLYHSVNGELDVFKIIPARGETRGKILDTAFSPDGEHFVYSGFASRLHVCSINGDPKVQDTLWLHPETRNLSVFSVVFSSDGNEIISSASDGFLYVYDLKDHHRTLRVRAHSKDANVVTFADDSSQVLISGGDDGLCKVWDRRTLHESNAKPVGLLAGHRSGVTYIDSRNDGRHFISNSKDQTIKLWDLRAFSGTEGEENTLRAVDKISFNYQKEVIPFSISRDRTLLDGDTSIMTYRGHMILNTLIRCRFSPAVTTGQRYIYTGSADGGVIIYDVLTGKKVSRLKKHNSCVRDASWHPHHPQIVSSSWNGSIESWDGAPEEFEEPDNVYDSVHPIWH